MTYYSRFNNIFEVNKTVERGSARFSPDSINWIGKKLQIKYELLWAQDSVPIFILLGGFYHRKQQ